MLKVNIPYYKESLELNIPENEVNAVLTPKAMPDKTNPDETEIVLSALMHPVASPFLADLAEGKKHVVIISSDHTRPVPSKITMPLILKEIRRKNKDARVTILVATGMHRPTTASELLARYGEEIGTHEEIVVHNAYDDANMAYFGLLPSGGEIWLNKLVKECDLLVAEGFIEPHFFAGFSGGRKSVLPGVASKKTVLWNHNAKFIASDKARAGILDENPINQDMIYAASRAKLAFVLNVALDENKKIIKAFAGDFIKAHRLGCDYVGKRAGVRCVPADIVITSNGGYPLDQNLYQSVKGMTAGEACVRPGGVIIMCASCIDGSGGDFFYHLLADEKDAETAYRKLNDVAPADTQFDQWEAQILARILCKATVILVSKHVDPRLPHDMHLKHTQNLNDAVILAKKTVGEDKKITIIPDGVGVILS